ncbi:unnamed protein product [Paramecium primaurelia]|uniref:Uncharacterized protein n=1 Tax=Paramecium primaurelia TaxID=5886 RepID=A0A8S1K2R4_PARPR|nr:unnamed protein product [Paramecium primaurelia]
MQTWDSELPHTMQKKLSLLLEQRENLQQQESQLKQKNLLFAHKKSLSKLQNQNQQTVETLLENEKIELIDIFDQELINQNSRRYSSRRMPTLEQSAISFQEQSAVFHKSNKTNRSASTNLSYFNTQSPQRLSKFKIDTNTSRIQDQDQTIKQLQSIVAEQQEKSLIQNQEIQILKEKNQSLIRQLEISEKNFIKFQKQTDLFKENLVEKLKTYAQKLEALNENEEKIMMMQKENARLKQEKEELLFLMRNNNIGVRR